MTKAKKQYIEKLILNCFPAARISCSVIMQLESCLPIASFDSLMEARKEIEIEGLKLPTGVFRKHLNADLFPIKTIDELTEKVCRGVERGLTLANSPAAPFRHPEINTLLDSAYPDRVKSVGVGLRIQDFGERK